MQWGAPYFIFLLLGAIPFILFLHSLRLKGKRVKTTALFLLERVLEERPLGQRLGWLLRNNLLLVLQLLAALLLILALADPSLLGFGPKAGDLVVVVDASASMKARGPGGSRFEAGRRALLALIDDKPRGQRVMVIEAGPMVQVRIPFTSDSDRLRSSVQALAPTDAPAKVKEAILFAHSFLRHRGSDQVVVMSDGAFEGAADLPWSASSLRWVGAEGGKDNVGILGFEFRRVPEQADEYEIMIRIGNFTDRAARVPLIITAGEEPLVREVVEIQAGGQRVRIYAYRGPLPGRVTALLAVKDDFATDNHAFLALSQAPALHVLYVGNGNFFLERLLRSFPGIRLTRTRSLKRESFAEEVSPYDVVVLDGVAAPTLVEGNFILINTVAEGIPLRPSGRVSRPRPLPRGDDHPLARGLRLDNLYIKEAMRLVPREKAITLAGSQETPLIVGFESERLRALVFGFDLLDSDLPFKVSFPLLFHNAFTWFRPGSVEFPAVQVQAGSSHTIHLAEASASVKITTPSRREEFLEGSARSFPFAGTLEVGFYGFEAGAREGQFAVNLFSESESQIRSDVAFPETNGKVKTGEAQDPARRPLWPMLLVGVAVLLAVEGFLFFRAGGSLQGMLFRQPALAAVVMALVNPHFFRALTALDVVLAVDRSRSVGESAKEQASPVLDEAKRLSSQRTRVGLLSFAKQPVWEFLPRRDFSLPEFSPAEGREQTNITAALQAAHAQLGEGREGRILLVSDGNENLGRVRGLVPFLRSHGVQLWALPVGFSRQQNEVYVKDLVLPHQVDSAETFEVRAAVESLRQATAEVKLLRDGRIRRTVPLTLNAGTNWVRFSEVLTERGSHTLEILVDATEDTLPENNLLQGVVQVKGPPRVLYLFASRDAERIVARVLRVQGYEVDEAAARERVLSLAEISGYDLVVLDNLPAYLLSQAKMAVIERYVRDLGGGLIVLGGPKSYGAGGYYRTALERVLPVEMKPPVRVEFPQVTLLFVLDKSGSMGEGPDGATKLDLAKAAAIASAELLNPSDQVGLLAFDAEWKWVVPFTPVGEVQWISGRIASLQADGGTDLYKAMVEAHRSFESKEGAVKHVLVLSDGLTDKGDFRDLVDRMVHRGITVSTVSVGGDADRVLLAEIAQRGRGRGYATVDPTTIPQIFTTETLLISRDLLIEKRLQPRMAAGHGPMVGISPKGLPPVDGYVWTYPKPLAEVLMTVEENPLLATWRYGLGQVVAYTSDLTSRWGKDWVRWKDFPRWASQLARSAMKRVSENRVQTEFQQEGAEVKALVDVYSVEGRFVNQLDPKGILTGPDQGREEMEFQQVAPGRYATRFSIPRSGTYFMTIYDPAEGEKSPKVATTVPFISPYSPEYRHLKTNNGLLSYLTEQTGGRFLQPENLRDGVRKLLTPGKSRSRAADDTWWPLAALGLFLFLSDLAVRRLFNRAAAQ